MMTMPPNVDDVVAANADHSGRKPWKVTVEVLAVPGDANEPVHWGYVAEFEKGSNGKNQKNRMEFPKNGGMYDIEFKLKDSTDLDLAFFTDPTEAIYAEVGKNCPTSKGDADGYLILKQCCGDTLCVTNKNDQDAKNKGTIEIHYALRFSGKPTTLGSKSYPPYCYDPIMSNGGKG